MSTPTVPPLRYPLSRSLPSTSAFPLEPGWSTSTPLLSGVAGTEQTIALIRRTVDEGLRDPLVRQTAGAIVRPVPAHNEEAEARAIYQWVLRNIRFTMDPAGKETVSSPRWTLTHGFGDCDDINAVLLPSLLGVIGHRTRLVTISSNPHAPDQFSHVYAEALLRGRWVPLDAARRGAQFGRAPARFYRKRVWALDNGSYQDVGLAGYHISTGLGSPWDIIREIGEQVRETIPVIRIPRERLVLPLPPPPAGQPAAPQPPPQIRQAGIDTNTLLIGGGLLFLVLMAGKKKRP